MKKDYGKEVKAYRRLFEIIKQERHEIAHSNLQGIEHCCSLKLELIGEIQTFGDNSTRSLPADERAEIEGLVRETMALHETNTREVMRMKSEIVNEISSVHERKTACRAYQKGSGKV